MSKNASHLKKVSLLTELKFSLLDAKQIAGRIVLALVLLSITALVIDQFGAFSNKIISEVKMENLTVVATLLLVSFALESVWFVAWSLVISVATQDHLDRRSGHSDIIQLLRLKISPLIIENTRSAAAILIRVPLLIIPAVIEFVRLSFVSNIVVFDLAYAQGEVDALQKSRQLCQGLIGKLATLIGLRFALSLLTTVTLQRENSYIWEQPLSVLTSVSVNLVLDFIFCVLLYRVFHKRFSDN
jgi:hypothetical protein